MAALGLTELDADIAIARTAVNTCLTAMQSVSRPSMSYVRANLTQAKEHLKELLNMRRTMAGGNIAVSDESGSSGFDSATADSAFTDPNPENWQ